jgi:hypothetical protein
MGLLVFVYAAAACGSTSPVSDPGDLDQDGVKDDPCIAPASDAAGDFDSDGIANADDPCPANFTRDSDSDSDGDGDGIPDVCDPFPMVAGDRHHCTMVFSDPALDAALWEAPAGSAGFTYDVDRGKSILKSDPPRTLSIATANIEAPATTGYDMDLELSGALPNNVPTAFTLYLRAGSAPSDSDVGCALNAVPGQLSNADWQLAIVQGSTVLSAANVHSSNGWVFATMQAVVELGVMGTNVRCYLNARVWFGSENMSYFHLGPVTAEVRLPAGNVGFATDTTATVRRLSIYSRDDAPSL